MKANLAFGVLVALAAATIEPRSALAQMHPAANLQQNEIRSRQMLSSEMTNNQISDADAVAQLKEHRARLAQAWQTLGLTPQAAEAVAGAYRMEPAGNGVPVSLRGKSSQEVAAMLQKALANKDYVLANHLLIAYHGRQARASSKESPSDRD